MSRISHYSTLATLHYLLSVVITLYLFRMSACKKLSLEKSLIGVMCTQMMRHKLNKKIQPALKDKAKHNVNDEECSWIQCSLSSPGGKCKDATETSCTGGGESPVRSSVSNMDTLAQQPDLVFRDHKFKVLQNTELQSCYSIPLGLLEYVKIDIAYEVCYGLGWELLIIDSQEEFDYLQKEIGSRKRKSGWWIALNDDKKEGEWYWKPDCTPATYMRWAEESEKNSRKENCAVFGVDPVKDYQGFYPQSCRNEAWPFMCEKNLPECQQLNRKRRALLTEGNSSLILSAKPSLLSPEESSLEPAPESLVTSAGELSLASAAESPLSNVSDSDLAEMLGLESNGSARSQSASVRQQDFIPDTSCYNVSVPGTLYTRDEARAQCRIHRHGDLTSIISPEELVSISKVVQNVLSSPTGRAESFWTGGGNNFMDSDKWVWQMTCEVGKYLKWVDPIVGPTRNCLTYQYAKSVNNLGIWTNNCMRKFRYICKKKIKSCAPAKKPME